MKARNEEEEQMKKNENEENNSFFFRSTSQFLRPSYFCEVHKARLTCTEQMSFCC
jgi:hypothetical protein